MILQVQHLKVINLTFFAFLNHILLPKAFQIHVKYSLCVLCNCSIRPCDNKGVLLFVYVLQSLVYIIEFGLILCKIADRSFYAMAWPLNMFSTMFFIIGDTRLFSSFGSIKDTI